jgi:hypothetical protein
MRIQLFTSETPEEGLGGFRTAEAGVCIELTTQGQKRNVSGATR